MFIDVDALRLDLIKYFGTAMQSNSIAMVDLIRVQNASDYEVVDIAVKNGTAVFGELSLAGEIRPVTKTKQRVKAAESLGFNTIIQPSEENQSGISDIKALIKTIFR